jgi:hypothetical protein
MKKLILSVLTTACAASVFAQGGVVFNNRVGGTSHVWAGGTTQYQGNAPTGDSTPGTIDYAALGCKLIGTVGGLPANTTFAQLLGAPGSGAPESALLPGLPVTTFRTGAASGNIFPATATFNNIPLDAPFGTFEMVAWDNSSGLYPTWAEASVAARVGLIMAGRSAPFTLASIGGNIFTPPTLEPALQSFNIYFVPEPATAALAGLGAAALLIVRRRRFHCAPSQTGNNRDKT